MACGLKDEFTFDTIFIIFITTFLSFNAFIECSFLMYPLECSDNRVQKCNSYLYHISNGHNPEEVASLYMANKSQIEPITHGTNQDFLVSVPCTCKDVNGSHAYFYDVSYEVGKDDTFDVVNRDSYSGQAWKVNEKGNRFLAGNSTSIHLLCGCVDKESQHVVTYTVQDDDTLSDISVLLSSDLDGIERLNGRMTQRPNFIDIGWVLFVPVERNRKIDAPAPDQGRRRGLLVVIIGILLAVTLFSIGALTLYIIRRYKVKGTSVDSAKFTSAKRTSLQKQFLQQQYIENAKALESEKPVIFSLEEIIEATNGFNETWKIGEGGYGIVYFGILREKEVAIKKMKSNQSNEFFAELKVLCNIHHINVVELIGYATGVNHLYLVYEYVQNGSLADHLREPMLNDYLPLPWIARAHIALDAARGIEYLHDHTKACYVHRDIKTSNILLDHRLGAKVADFGLAKLIQRSNEEDCVATRLVGTPGYLPPESVRELQTTPKGDVFAFGVVLAELITGQSALERDDQEPHKMKSLVFLMHTIFHNTDLETALEAHIDGKLKGNYPKDQVYKMAETAWQCLNEQPTDRPDMQEIVVTLSRILISSIEWEASLGGNDQVFTWYLQGR